MKREKCTCISKSQVGKEHPTYHKRKANRIGDVLRVNCLIEEKVLWKKRRGRRRKQLLDGLKESQDTGN
jgi:hypothetical protein